MANFMYGSICLSNVPKEQFKKVMCKDGIERVFLNIKVVESKKPSQYGDTHFISCEPKQEERKEGVSYIIGNLKTFTGGNNNPSPEQVATAPAAENDDLPF